MFSKTEKMYNISAFDGRNVLISKRLEFLGKSGFYKCAFKKFQGLLATIFVRNNCFVCFFNKINLAEILI